MTDGPTTDAAASARRWAAGVIAVAALLAGLFLIRGLQRTGVVSGILLWIVALTATAVAVGADRAEAAGPARATGAGAGPGTAAPGPAGAGAGLDLSARLATGVLGGVLGSLASTAAIWISGALGITGLLGVQIPAGAALTGLSEAGASIMEGWGGRAWAGALWGIAFGIVYPVVPGRGAAARGALFSLAPSLWLLLKVFPVDRELGLFGHQLGALTFVLVLLFNLVWGLALAGVVRWGEVTEYGPISRPLVE